MRQNRRLKIVYNLKQGLSPALNKFGVFMKITKIEQQKKNKKRMSVFIDGEFSFGADSFALLSLRLNEGDEISKEKLAVIKNTAVFEDAKNYAANLVSARSYTVKAMREKLIAHIGDNEVVDKTIDFLKEYKLLDDYDYALRFFHDLVHIKKLGLQQVKWKLKEKGISSDIVEKVLEELDVSDTILQNLESVALKKLKGNYDAKNIIKVKRYLASRGYTFDQINSVFSKIKAEDKSYDR